MNEAKQHNPDEVARKQQELREKTAQFCAAHLDAEMQRLCAQAIEELGRSAHEIESLEPQWWELAPLERGDLTIWAGGIVYALASANKLFKAGATPRLKASSIDEFFGLRKGASAQRTISIRELLHLDRGDSEFFTAAMQERRAAQETFLAAAPDANFARGGHEFADDTRDAMNDFYDLTEELDRLSEAKIEARLRAIIKRDPFFLDSYLTLAEIREADGADAEARRLRDAAYTQALRLIRDKEGRWPAAMEWGFLENRHVMRALTGKAMQSWQDGASDEALAIFRNLLFACPGDNLGVRYLILAIREGLTFEQYDKKFVTREGFYDSDKLFKWFDKGVEKLPDEFAKWKRVVDEWQ